MTVAILFQDIEMDEVNRLIAEHGIKLRHERRGIGLCIYGLWLLLPKGWERKPEGWMHVLRYAPFLKDWVLR